MRYHKEGYTCAGDRGNPKKPDRHTQLSQLQLHRHLNHPFPHPPYPSMAHLVRLSASVIESHTTTEANIRYQRLDQRPTFFADAFGLRASASSLDCAHAQLYTIEGRHA